MCHSSHKDHHPLMGKVKENVKWVMEEENVGFRTWYWTGAEESMFYINFLILFLISASFLTNFYEEFCQHKISILTKSVAELSVNDSKVVDRFVCPLCRGHAIF